MTHYVGNGFINMPDYDFSYITSVIITTYNDISLILPIMPDGVRQNCHECGKTMTVRPRHSTVCTTPGPTATAVLARFTVMCPDLHAEELL